MIKYTYYIVYHYSSGARALLTEDDFSKLKNAFRIASKEDRVGGLPDLYAKIFAMNKFTPHAMGMCEVTRRNNPIVSFQDLLDTAVDIANSLQGDGEKLVIITEWKLLSTEEVYDLEPGDLEDETSVDNNVVN